MFKTAWQLLMSPFVAITWVVLAILLYIGWGSKQVDAFIEAWADMLNGKDDGPVTGGPLPPDPMDEMTESGYTFRELEEVRKRGEGIG